MSKNLNAYLSSLKQLVLGLGAGLGLMAAGCGTSGPMDQTLGKQTFDYMIPATPVPPGTTLPSIPCTDASVCRSFLAAGGISIPGLTAVCAANVCQADLKLTILYIIDASNDPAFTLGIAQGEADSMRDVKMTYGISSTVNLAINQIDVYVGPDGLRSPGDPNAIYLGTVGPIPAMSNIADGMNYLLLPDGTPAHTAFVNYAKHPENKFDVLMVATTPRLMPGDPIPSGMIEVRMIPIVTLLSR